MGGGVERYPTSRISQALDGNTAVCAQGDFELLSDFQLPLEGVFILQEVVMQKENSLFQEFVLLCELLGLLVQFQENWINDC